MILVFEILIKKEKGKRTTVIMKYDVRTSRYYTNDINI